MNSIYNLLGIDDVSVLFLAPPAWGKTRMILEMVKTYKGRVFYISPLRALSEEFRKNFRLGELYSKGSKNFKIYINTAEKFLIDRHQIEVCKEDLLVIDEVHLFYLWEGFREKLLEFREETLCVFNKALCLSATMTEDLKQYYKKEFLLNFRDNIEIDLGNLTLKNYPEESYKLYKNRCFFTLLLLSRLKHGRVLLFVKYRSEVDEFLKLARWFNIKALGCKGGQAYEFSKLSLGESEFFVSTTVLSHGVNLPSINTVIINYDLQDEVFFLQMISRAGRRGEKFQVYSMNDILKLKRRAISLSQYGELIRCIPKLWC